MAEIIDRGGRRWLVRVFLGRDPQTGKVRYRNKTVKGGKKDAQAVANALETQRSKGLLVIEDTTISGLLDDLIRDYKLNGQDHEWCKLLVDVKKICSLLASYGHSSPTK